MPTVMTEIERDEFSECDRKLQDLFSGCVRKYLEIGRIMSRILKLELYREKYKTFDVYIASRWKLEPATFRKWASYADIADRLKESESNAPLLFVSQLEGFNLSHAMALSKLPADLQAEAWTTANRIQESPTAKALKTVVNEFKDEFEKAKAGEMTKEEELDFLTRAEAASEGAILIARAIETAKKSRKRLAKIKRALSESRFTTTFEKVVEHIDKADGMLDKYLGNAIFQEA